MENGKWIEAKQNSACTTPFTIDHLPFTPLASDLRC